jgi:hypothetical protein
LGRQLASRHKGRNVENEESIYFKGNFQVFSVIFHNFSWRAACDQVYKDIESRKMLTDNDFSRLQMLYSTTLAASLGLVDMSDK